MLSVERQTEILQMHFVQKLKVRAISRKLNLCRKTVGRVIARRGVALDRQKVLGRKTILSPYHEGIKSVLRKDSSIPAVVIFQNLRRQGYSGGKTTVKNLVQKIKSELTQTRNKEAFFKMDFAAGSCAQVDWGEFADVFNDGVKVHCFVMVLAYSRMIYIEFTRSEKFEEFLRCHENAFRYFGGLVPETLWYDNLPTAVSARHGRLVGFNRRFMAYAGHHYFSPHACNLARGNEKGRVEDGVKYIRSNFWSGRSFSNFKDICDQACDWRDNIANYREHAATGKIPKLVFEAEEKVKLRKSNTTPYETDEILSKQVSPQYHFTYETNQYSVPWTLVGLVLTVRIDAECLSFFYNEKFITRHARCYLKHQKPFTKPEHEEGLIERKPAGADAHMKGQVDLLEGFGESLKEYLKCLRHNGRSIKSEIPKLLALSTVYGGCELEVTVAEILRLGVIGVERIEKLLKVRNTKVQNPAPLALTGPLAYQPGRVDLRSYNQLLFNKEENNQTENRNGNCTEPTDGGTASGVSGPEASILDKGNESGPAAAQRK